MAAGGAYMKPLTARPVHCAGDRLVLPKITLVHFPWLVSSRKMIDKADIFPYFFRRKGGMNPER